MTYRRRFNNNLKCNDFEYFPISLRSNMFPLSTANFTYTEEAIKNEESEANSNEIKQNDGRVQITNKIMLPQTDLTSFGIWGRVFDRDGIVPTHFSKEDVEKYIEIENVIYNSEKDRSFMIDDEL